MDEPGRGKLSDHPIVVIIGLIASLIAIFTFVTGKKDIPSLVEPTEMVLIYEMDAPTQTPAPTGTSTSAPAREVVFPTSSTTSGQQGNGNIYFKNDCELPVRVAIGYQDTNGAWQNHKWWAFSGNSASYFADLNNARLTTMNSYLYYYVETTDGSNLKWQGSSTFSFDGENLPAREAFIEPEQNGDRIITLTCPSGDIYIENHCTHPVRVALSYQDKRNTWQYVLWWQYNANTSSYALDINSNRLSSFNGYMYFYAETTDGSGITWQGQNNYLFGDLTLPTKELALTLSQDGRWIISLSFD